MARSEILDRVWEPKVHYSVYKSPLGSAIRTLFYRAMCKLKDSYFSN